VARAEVGAGEGGSTPMSLSALALIAGVAILYFGAEWLVRGAVELGQRMGVSPIVIGLTIVSIGTSAPEFVVSVLAALRGSPELAVGNVLGSNLANVGLILGAAAILRPLQVNVQVVRRDIPWMLGVTLLLVPLLWNGGLGRVEGGVLAAVLVLYIALMIPAARRESTIFEGEVGGGVRETGGRRFSGARSVLMPLGLVVAGCVGLVVGGQGIVFGATNVAAALGVPELIVGLSVVAVGTSLPELATTLVAAARNEADLAVGNIVGSNIFNVTFVLGGTALVRPFEIPERILQVEYPVTLAMSLLLIPVAFRGRDITRREGVLLLLAYAGAWGWILMR
jgi:cation:H+ antiporter